MKKFKKRAAAIALSLALAVAAIPTTAFAANTSGSSAQTQVTYTAEASYIVTIPDTLNLTENGGSASATVTCSHNSLAMSKRVKVSIDTSSTLTSDGNFYLTNTATGSKVRCCITNHSGVVTASNSEIDYFNGGETTGNTGGDFSVCVEGVPPDAGEYTGTIYFSITVE